MWRAACKISAQSVQSWPLFWTDLPGRDLRTEGAHHSPGNSTSHLRSCGPQKPIFSPPRPSAYTSLWQHISSSQPLVDIFPLLNWFHNMTATYPSDVKALFETVSTPPPLLKTSGMVDKNHLGQLCFLIIAALISIVNYHNALKLFWDVVAIIVMPPYCFLWLLLIYEVHRLL